MIDCKCPAATHGSFSEVRQNVEGQMGGSLMQLNHIGALTVATFYWELGRFETILWDDRHPEMRGFGFSIAGLHTLQDATAFHYAYSKLLWEREFGQEARERTEWFGDAVAELAAEIPTDDELFADYTEEDEERFLASVKAARD